MIDREVFYWAPGVKWEKIDHRILVINRSKFMGFPASLFPEFYYSTLQGCYISDILQKFSKIAEKKMRIFILDLIRLRVLVHTILDIDNLFLPVEQIYESNYQLRYDYMDVCLTEKTIGDSAKLKRERYNHTPNILLYRTEDFEQLHRKRKTYREFDRSRQISFYDFSKFLEALELTYHNKQIRGSYPSAGDLYPVDSYLLIKADAVENVACGLYYYNPFEHAIRYISDSSDIEDSIHYGSNRTVFNDSAFSIFLCYNNEVAYNKYRGRAYYFGIIESGIIAQALSVHAQNCGMGSCIIGNMDFSTIKSKLCMSETSVHLLDMEFGILK